MPKNITGGKHKKNKNKPIHKARKPEDLAKDITAYEVYGQITKALGNRRFEVCCQKLELANELYTLVCSLKGSYRKKISKDSYVLIKLFEFNKTQGIIIDCYSNDELVALKGIGKWDFPLELVFKKETAVIDLPSDSSDDGDGEDEDENENEDNDNGNDGNNENNVSDETPVSVNDVDIDNI